MTLLHRSKSTNEAAPRTSRGQLDLVFAELRSAGTTTSSAAESTSPFSNLARLSRRNSLSSPNYLMHMNFLSSENGSRTVSPAKRDSIVPNRAAPPPPLRLSNLPPPRSACSPGTSNDATSDTSLEPDFFEIGMALGSPTGVGEPVLERQERFSIFPSNVSNNQPDTMPFTLPTEPFWVEAKGSVAEAARKVSKKETIQEEPSRGGWRKMFGKSFFGKKSTQKSRESSPSVSKSEMIRSPQIFAKLHKTKNHGKPSQAPCLNVDIPEVEMERYSVMFGTLLQPSEKSSLFARRRSREVTVDNGQPSEGNQTYLTPLKRNATTGQVCRSPLSMLGDTLRQASTPSPGHSPNRNSGLHRSKTTLDTPAGPSPRTYVVNGNSDTESYHTPKEFLPTPSEITPESQALTARPFSKVSKISEESSIDTPRGSFDEGDDEWLTKEDEAEPQWEMVTRRSPPSISSDTTTKSEAEESIATAAQISIARQISISQRQLLLPLVPKSQRLVSRRAPLNEPMSPQIVNHRLSAIPSSLNVEYGFAQQ